ncbi:YaiO family outer membrane beta-barrel protein [Sunxiuqinia elliptica]|uniref:YaiO family outer membrane protein n=1 Tax=Sunxiuqinia elliptica TaxID=655355 RepID=A0A4R6HBE8_9BACT|nr:YaiO family outer membrane beta-barrel protein [Sunxiuqinia elliptica]TDO05484.1 YaiO family outer membrane protein [Sunxiuqinia elliptica]TDO65030.1 YaiO family outer membrane protein [Sunxiuqinia elliptica]
MKRICSITIALVALMVHFVTFQANAQDYTSDELFQMARTAAFEEDDYPKAIKLSKQALEISPDYSDIRIFLGRIYTWTDRQKEAREAFRYVLERYPGHEDASMAITDLEYWNDNNQAALEYCNKGLEKHPDSEGLLLKKARILNNMKRFDQAYQVAENLLEQHPENDEARSLQRTIRYDSAKNKLSVSHDFSWFDSKYPAHLHDSPWHIVGVDYSRYTKIGSVIGRVNWGRRFDNTAFQYEIDSYPYLAKNIMAYMNVGFSDQSAVFPRFRAGMSLYFSLPKAFEAEAGARFLRFSSNTWIYVASVSKYYKSYWFNLKTYLVPGNEKISHSYTMTTRYYTGGADDYWKFSFGYGLSPDDAVSVQNYISDYRLKSAHIGLGFRKSIKRFNVIGLSASYINQEFRKDQKGNQINTSVTYIRKF